MGKFEKMAIFIYNNHPKLKKAIASGRAIDNSLELTHRQSGVSDGGKFMLDNYFSYFDYNTLVKRGLIKKYLSYGQA